MGSLSGAVTEAVVRRLAGDQPYGRGYDYFRHGHVESLEEAANGVRAVVRGNRDYAVTLSADEGVLDYSCDCAQGAEGAFCKHCAAAALAWLERNPKSAKRKGGAKRKRTALADVSELLLAEEKQNLVGLVIESWRGSTSGAAGTMTR